MLDRIAVCVEQYGIPVAQRLVSLGGVARQAGDLHFCFVQYAAFGHPAVSKLDIHIGKHGLLETRGSSAHPHIHCSLRRFI